MSWTSWMSGFTPDFSESIVKQKKKYKAPKSGFVSRIHQPIDNTPFMRNSCHIGHLMKCPNWCRTRNICFLLIFSWKMLKPNFAFWDIFLQLRLLNSKGIKLQRSIRVICIIFDLIFFQLKIKNITNIPSSTTISTLCQASNMTWIAQLSAKYIFSN